MSTGAIDANEVRIAPFGHVSIAAQGSAAPTDVTTALSSAWTDIGYVDESGVAITPNVDITDIMAWQSNMPVKRTPNTVNIELKFVMLQTNKTSTKTFFLGGTWTNGAAGIATLTIPSTLTISALESALCVEYRDDELALYRMYIARGLFTQRETLSLVRNDAVKYGVTYVVNDNNGVGALLLTNAADLYSS